MILTGKNYIDQASLSCSNSGVNQILDNLKIPQLSKNWSASSTTTSILIDLMSVKYVGSFIIDIGNLAGAEVNIEARESEYGDPVFTQTLTETASCFYGLPNVEYRYWRLNIDGKTKIPTFGYITLCDYLQMPAVNPDASIFYSTTTQKTTSISGQQFTDAGYQYMHTEFEFPQIPDQKSQFLGKTVAGRQEIVAAWKQTEFQYAWLLLWENSLEKIPPVFGSVDSDTLQFTRSESDGLYWNMSFSFKEIK